MRSLKTGLLTFVTAGFFGMAAVIGCSADGAGDVIEDSNATEPTGDDGAQLPPSNPGSSSSSSGSTTTKDAGKDASKSDAGKDAGPPPPNPGDACTKIDQIFKKSCGACGTQEAVCEADGDAGAGKVSAYGVCQGEVAGGCIPGTTEDVACGNCGTAKKTCNQYCAWSTGACTGQPANSCKPGGYEYTAAGCPANQYRKRDCQTSCVWTNYGTCATPVNDIVLPINGTAGQTAAQTITHADTKVGPKLSGTCPNASISTTTSAYEYVEVKNSTAKSATVTLYTSQAAGGQVLDTIIAYYDKAIQPMDDNSRKACTSGVADQSYSDTALTGNSNFSIIKNVVIPAGGSILVYVATWDAYDAADNTTFGPVKLNVKTDALN